MGTRGGRQGGPMSFPGSRLGGGMKPGGWAVTLQPAHLSTPAMHTASELMSHHTTTPKTHLPVLPCIHTPTYTHLHTPARLPTHTLLHTPPYVCTCLATHHGTTPPHEPGPIQAALVETLAAAASHMGPADKARPGPGPPPLLYFVRALPPAEQFKPVLLWEHTRGQAGAH